MSKIELGELMYEYTLNITGMTEYGVSFEALMSGQVPPPEGARFDVAFEGKVTGQKLNGHAKGIDHIYVRADGRMELNIRAEITTSDGQKIALHATGVALGRENSPIADLSENVSLFSSSEDYKWVNTVQVWGKGTVNFETQIVQLSAYSA